MANSLSSKKRIRQNERDRELNRVRKSIVKSKTRKFLEAVHDGNAEKARDAFVVLQKSLDQTAAKGTLHKNTVARRKSRLIRHLNAMTADAGSK